MSAEKPQPPATFRGRALGGLRAAANMSPEERSARARAAAEARWSRENERRAAEGLPPLQKRAPLPSAEELEPWLDELDRRYPKRQWASSEARRREAILLLRTAAAEAASEAMKRRES